MGCFEIGGHKTSRSEHCFELDSTCRSVLIEPILHQVASLKFSWQYEKTETLPVSFQVEVENLESRAKDLKNGKKTSTGSFPFNVTPTSSFPWKIMRLW